MSNTSWGHAVFHHRYRIVWITKYRYKALEGALRERIRVIIRQVCKELGVRIVSGVLSREHVHMFVEIPPHIAVSDFGQSRAETHRHINYWPRECSMLQAGKGWSGSCHKIGCSTISRVS
ncbi:MAG: IS200/IS605 family transposase [Beijerinckiaceae bacterium]